MIAAALLMLLQIETLALPQAEERLIDWAIADFRAHAPGSPKAFRAVHMARLADREGTVRPLLCGEVQVEAPGGSAEWVRFASLDTPGGREHYLGRSADGWCNEGTARDLARDFSERFTRALVRD